jgi:hypothetical protein
MPSNHAVTDNIVYDLVSIQYHALQAIESYASYLGDAHSADHADISSFIERCRDEDTERAQRCHELLKELTATT